MALLEPLGNHDDLLAGETVLDGPEGGLAPTLRPLGRRRLRHRNPGTVGILTSNELVDESGRRGAGAGGQRRADAVRIHGRCSQRRDRELVQVAGDRDAGLARPERVELPPHLRGDDRQVARIDAYAAEPSAGDLDRRCDARFDVVGVDEESRLVPEGAQLRCEGIGFAVVQQRPAVCCRSHRRNAPPASRFQVACRTEPRDERRSGRGNSRKLTGSP